MLPIIALEGGGHKLERDAGVGGQLPDIGLSNNRHKRL
jgi:hypothetical protein